jgi:NAD(P)-dependent dehydrogenase (short-subunit alcohol dehydrogenase family)
MTERIVLITGSGRGIGLAVAARFCRAGDTVIAAVRDPTRAGDLRSALALASKQGDAGEGDATTSSHSIVALDVTDADAVEHVVTETIELHGRIDILVNNAGRSFVGTLEDLTDEDLQASLEVNFLGAARLTRAVLPAMRAAESGRILALSSMAGVVGNPFNDGYSVAKFALEGLYESLAPVVAPLGIRLTLVEPGPVAGEFVTSPLGITRTPSSPYTEMWERFISTRDAAYMNAPTPEDVAERIFELCGEADPPLRAQDTEGTSRFVATKLRETDGRRVMRIGSRMIGEVD